mmetsp:Transcript_19232/g.20857  ORF Transcript_19232/g.20857 Transcript_19232/m.20857 type:complete len:156 (+) Transcript_19232:87-554(+)
MGFCFFWYPTLFRHHRLKVNGKTSIIRSVIMDNLSEIEIRTMKLGGNEKFNTFLATHKISKYMKITEKYLTAAALLYRSQLNAEVNDPSACFPEGANIDLGEERQVGAGSDDTDGRGGFQWSTLDVTQVTDMVFSYFPSKLFLIDEQEISANKNS